MLSFILPVYKPDLPLLRKCLDSIEAQSYKDVEIILSLDGPCEDVRQLVVSDYQGRVQVIENEHGGACRARNEGFKASKGEYVVFWDCDCIIEPGMAQQWVNALDKGKGDFVYSGYQFLKEGGCLNSQPFDPYLLKIRNYISSCFPVKREFVAEWDESLESLQDWDFWQSVVEKGAKGYFIQGYAFKTPLPDPSSISGKGCTPDVWLERYNKVRDKHKTPRSETVVTSMDYEHDAIHLAKLLNVDYVDLGNLNHLPHDYKKIVQVGFSLLPGKVEHHSRAFNDKKLKKYIFWTADNLVEIWNGLSLRALKGDDYLPGYLKLLNETTTQFVEDGIAESMMGKAGFVTKVLPLPMKQDKVTPMPEKVRVGVDAQDNYNHVLNVVEKSLPDVKIEPITGSHKIEDYSILIHYYQDRTMSNSVKRMIVSGRHVISNIKSPITGYIDDRQPVEDFIVKLVNRIREVKTKEVNMALREKYIASLSKDTLEGVLS